MSGSYLTMSGAGAIGVAAHLLLLAWLAPIAFFDDGRLAPDWVGTLVSFAALSVPLVIAVVFRTRRGFTAAAISGLVVSAIFFVGPGILVLIPTALYAYAAATSPTEPPPPTSARNFVYYAVVTVLIAFGLLGIASIGMFFLIPGVTLLVLAPLRRRRLIIWPVILLEVAAVLTYLYVAPFRCTATSAASTDGRTTSRTSCTNLFGQPR